MTALARLLPSSAPRPSAFVVRFDAGGVKFGVETAVLCMADLTLHLPRAHASFIALAVATAFAELHWRAAEMAERAGRPEEALQSAARQGPQSPGPA